VIDEVERRDPGAHSGPGSRQLTEPDQRPRPHPEGPVTIPPALTSGWPIATGAVEGRQPQPRQRQNGRHRRARWSLAGGEAILKLRALTSNGDFYTYWTYHHNNDNNNAPTTAATGTNNYQNRQSLPKRCTYIRCPTFRHLCQLTLPHHASRLRCRSCPTRIHNRLNYSASSHLRSVSDRSGALGAAPSEGRPGMWFRQTCVVSAPLATR